MDVFIMVGLPGTGKTAYARELTSMNDNSVHISSDEHHIRMFGSLKAGNGQEQNAQVFKAMHEKLRDIIKENEVDFVVYDATNINRKRRRGLYRNIKAWDKDTQVSIIYFSTPLNEILLANDWRKAYIPEIAVPWDTLHKMYRTLQVPRTGVDCDTFCLRGEQMFDYDVQTESIKDNTLDNCHTVDMDAHMLATLVKSSNKAMGDELEGVYEPHDCAPHHLESIDEHICMCLDNVPFFDEDHRNLTLVALFHDLGKAITKTMVTKEGVTKATYRGHADLSSNYFLNYLYHSDLVFEDYVDLVEVIHNHMHFHKELGEKNIRNNRLTEEVIQLGNKFANIDSASRIVGEQGW